MSAKLSILTLPQYHVANALYLNVLIIPRNFDPRLDDGVLALSPAWADCNLRLQAFVIDSIEEYPKLQSTATPYDLPDVKMNPDARTVFEFLATQFQINNSNKAPALTGKDEIKKYLPGSYRNAFNFTTPRTKQAVIGDEYHCALTEKAKLDETFKDKVTDDVSWGKVFAFCLRQPELAKKCGFIHTNLKIDLTADTYKNGGWLYVDLHPDCSYYTNETDDKNFIKRYAAKIPKLDFAKDRTVFGALQFPVLISDVPVAGEPVVPSMLDELQIEASEYDDGFCKIVHTNQPVNGNLLVEEEDAEHPVTNDVGIRLGWDDEQLLIWLHRQMSKDENLPGDQRADAPLGVFQYRVDVREKSEDEATPNLWSPLCRVRNKKDLLVGDVALSNAGDEIELGVEVYPAKPTANTDTFWLPSYFATWVGNSLVLPDENAIAIYQKDKIVSNSTIATDTDKLKKATKNNNYEAADLDVPLLYGHQYEFRVRMADVTGGGPTIDKDNFYDALAPVAGCHFKRYVIPQTLRFVSELPQADDAFFEATTLSLKRPLLGYPSVMFTGAYDDVVQQLIDDSIQLNTPGNADKRSIGLADPDVDRVEILVEVKGLAMDTTLPKKDPKDNFALFYSTYRSFSGAFDGQLDIDLQFADAPVIDFYGGNQLPDLGLDVEGETDINKRNDLVLPTARDIRITVRAICKQKDDYYGGKNAAGFNRTFLQGMQSSFLTRKAASKEHGIFKQTGEVNMIRGVYLQPDEPVQLKADINNTFIAKLATDNVASAMIERFAKAIDAENKGMSLLGKSGERWQFGVSRFIRHTTAPDNSSITFATKDDLLNHWLVPVTLLLNRDWSWDGVMPTSIQVYRRKIFLREAMQMMAATDASDFLNTNTVAAIFANDAITPVAKEELVGDVELKRTINIQALLNADRSQTHVCFIDAVEPKPEAENAFPAEILLAYRIAVNFNATNGTAPDHDDDVTLTLHLPITTPPAQVPKIVSAGLAFSKYVRDEKYANTEARKKYLWIEFEEPIQNPADAYYARLLAYAPDPLLAQWKPEMLIAPQEPPLAIDPEPIRIISSNHSDDKSGLNSMQEMIKANDSDVHYLLPLPQGMHTNSPELFGFFTYEFRVMHKHGWITAQGRPGRQIRNTGVQHPTPQLFCTASRNEKYISVSAPFAQAVFDGRNVTANPPRTQIWALLYAQVRMADDSDARNILLSDKKLIIPKPNYGENLAYLAFETVTNSDATPNGVTMWANKEVEALLELFGLPVDSDLSVLCVEMLPGYDQFLVNPRSNLATSINPLRDSTRLFNSVMNSTSLSGLYFQKYIEVNNAMMQEAQQQLQQVNEASTDVPRPLTSDLGNYRILRTSTLVAVPEVCCTE